MRLFICLFILFISASVISQKRYVQVDSATMWVKTVGIENRKEGQPVIVFENGHGVPMDNWDKVVEAMGKSHPLVTYDRAGIGKSTTINEVPSIQNVSRRLVALLEELKIPPPYLLVGHSLGGLYVRGFCNQYPELLAGVIIIDPADFTETTENRKDYYDILLWKDERVDSLINHFIKRRMDRHYNAPSAVKREGLYLEKLREQDFNEIVNSTLPEIPVHIITGGRFDIPEKHRSTSYDDELLFRSKMKHRISRWTNVIQTVEKGKLFYSADSGHYIQLEDPELVASSIDLAIQDFYQLKGQKSMID